MNQQQLIRSWRWSRRRWGCRNFKKELLSLQDIESFFYEFCW